MPHGEEMRRFEDLLAARGVSLEGNAMVEEEIRRRYETQCAVMILDSSGFTRLTQAHGIVHFLALVVDMNRRVEPLLHKHSALAHWFEADNVFGVFSKAEQALQCAVAIQNEMKEANEGRQPGSCLHVCIGIGYGTLLKIGEENIYGDEMNLASKLGEDTAGPGEILITEKAWQAVGGAMDGLEAQEQLLNIAGVSFPYYNLT